jgi:predicted metal-dependent hydrolase
MQIQINDIVYPIEITYKNNKNMYLRIKDGPKIEITAPNRTPERVIKKFIESNIDYIAKNVIKKEQLKNKKAGKFEYLGHYYDILYTGKYGITLTDTVAYIGQNTNIDNWYKKEAKEMFKEYYDECFKNFREANLKPDLKIRKMKSKWGVCNVTNNIITLNLELIKLNPVCLEYVIYHELCHLKHPDHSKKFWAEVEIYVPNYKKIKKMMKSV